MAALIAKTLVGEKRRTWRAISLSKLIRYFNIWARERAIVDEKKSKKKKKRTNITRVEGSQRIHYWSEYIKAFLDKAEKARADLGEEKRDELFDILADETNKAKAKELKKAEKEFEENAKKKPKSYKAEESTGYTLTSTMGGKVDLSKILLKLNHQDHLDAELTARKITTTMQECIDEFDHDADLDEIGWTRKKQFLKLDEARREVQRNKFVSETEALEKTKSILPLSDKMREVL